MDAVHDIFVETIKICIANCKGGPGKSTLTAMIAWYIGMLGKTVLVVDTDEQGDASALLGAKCASADGRGNAFAKYIQAKTLTTEFVDSLISGTDHENVFVLTGGWDTQIASLISNSQHGLDQTKSRLDALAEMGYDYVIFDTPPNGVYQNATLSICGFHLFVTGVGQLEINGAMTANATALSRNPDAKTVFVPSRLHLNPRQNPTEVDNLVEFYRAMGLDKVTLPLPYRDDVLAMAQTGVGELWANEKDRRVKPVASAVKQAANWISFGGVFTDRSNNEKEGLIARLTKEKDNG